MRRKTGGNRGVMLRLTVASVVFWLLCAGFCGGQQSGAATLSATASVPSSQAAEWGEYYRLNLQALVEEKMEGRKVGSKGIDLARDYIADQFKAAGLAPAVIATSLPSSQPASVASYFQTFSVRTSLRIVSQSLEIIGADGKSISTATDGRDFSVLGFSASGKVGAEAVFAGYGIVNAGRKYDSYSGMEKNFLKGRIAIVYRFEPVDAKGHSMWASQGERWSSTADMVLKVRAAVEHGASAVVIVNPPSPRVKTVNSASETLSATMDVPVVNVSTDFFRKMLTDSGVADVTAESLQSAANDGKLTPFLLPSVKLSLSADVTNNYSDAYNVVGQIEGAGELASQTIVIGAHYDHIGYGDHDGGTWKLCPGADDNASGASGVMTLAAMYCQRLKNGQLPGNRRRIVFVAFSGEEAGLLGARHMARNFKEISTSSDGIYAMVNMDMIGRLRDDNVQVWCIDSSPRWRELVAPAIGYAGLKMLAIDGNGPSDQAYFLSAKVPAVTFHTGAHSDLHKHTDTVDKINFDGAMKVLVAVDCLLGELLIDQKEMKFLSTSMPSGK